jgi:hypothetical protein
MNSNADQRAAFGAALYAAAGTAGFDKVRDLSDALNDAGYEITYNQVKRWIDGDSEPQRPMVLALEELCGLMPGSLSFHFGWIPAGVASARKVSTVEEAVMADKALGSRERRVILDLVRGLRK